MVQAVCYIFACTLHGRGFALCLLSFAIMAAAAADLMEPSLPSFACLARDEAILACAQPQDRRMSRRQRIQLGRNSSGSETQENVSGSS